MSVDTSALIKLQALRESYATELPSRLDALQQLWQQRHQPGMLTTLHIQTHSLAGSGATFGFGEVSRVARQLEILLKCMLAGERQMDADYMAEVDRQLVELRLAATRPDHWGLDLLDEQMTQEEPPAREIMLLEPDAALGQQLARQLESFGYTCRVMMHERALRDAIRSVVPLAAVLDADHYRSSAPLLDRTGHAVPLVFLSSREDFADRLRCVRAGGRAYFTKPVDALALSDTLDELTLRNPREPYRILIAEDTEDLARYYALTLDNAGMTTRTVTDPMAVMEVLHNFQPDLVLMDLYMPGCSGLELAAVIRQQQAFVGVPIVFLSGETDSDKQIIAMSHGADDFLNKSISPEHLARSVGARVVRSRNMRSLMMRDSLTGLYNHTSTKEQLDRELVRAARGNAAIAYAMIDIDRFKSINDNHGHPTGDRVIKSLSRYLKQRLRGSDVIGRYGGEEFAVILPDTTAQVACKVLDGIREGFSQLRHTTEHGDIQVTFSGGIAAYPAHNSAQSLNDAADKALYQAKQAGRNRLIAAE